jgi:hypothetical protein
MDALLASVVVLISSSTSKLTRENDKERISIAAAVLKKNVFYIVTSRYHKTIGDISIVNLSRYGFMNYDCCIFSSFLMDQMEQ